MNILIIKLNATGDVVRTTTLLRRLRGNVTWITAPANVVLLDGLRQDLRCLAWEDRALARDRRYSLVINLEDELDVASFVAGLEHDQLFGACLDNQRGIAYTDDSHRWFDLSLISVHGRESADRLKLQNRCPYQELIFDGLGFQFEGEQYLLPAPAPTDLSGDVAIAPVAGPVWPNKSWAYYDELKGKLELAGLRVNVLPRRHSLLEHMADVSNHKVLVGGDSLPMHFALGTGTPCVTLFNCTSPWEIYDYGLQTKIVSPLLEKFFYQRGTDSAATSAINLDEVYDATMRLIYDAAVAVEPRAVPSDVRGIAAR